MTILSTGMGIFAIVMMSSLMFIILAFSIWFSFKDYQENDHLIAIVITLVFYILPIMMGLTVFLGYERKGDMYTIETQNGKVYSNVYIVNEDDDSIIVKKYYTIQKEDMK